MRQDTSNLVLFLGHFHPLLVHLPIGGLVLLGVLELVACVTRWKDAAKNSLWILGFVSVAACASGACGWMLAQGPGYGQQLLKWHRAAGLALTGACLVSLLLRQREQLRAYRVSLVATLLLLGVAGHLGASLTHGGDFLTRNAPALVRTFLDRLPFFQPAKTAAASSPIQQPALTGLVQSILREHCSDCHGVEFQMGKLRLDSIEGLLRGGRHGPAIKVGDAKDSPLIQRLLSPLHDNDHMPPEGELQPSDAEIALLERWINAGAPAAEQVEARKPQPGIRRGGELVSKAPELP